MRRRASLFSILLIPLLILAACREQLSVEQQIIGTIETMEAAAEQGRHLDFMGHIADGFRAQYGSMDRREFHRFMIFQMNENRRLHANFFPIRVRQTADNGASAEFRVLVTGGGGLIPDRGQLFDVQTEWILDGGDWLLLKADWETTRVPD